MLADSCTDPGFLQGVSRLDCQKTALTTFFFLFCPQLLLFYSGLLMVYFKENYNFTRFRGGGGGGGETVSNIHFPGGPNLFQLDQTFSRGVGVQMLILETHRTCDFPGGGANPLSPSPVAPRM